MIIRRLLGVFILLCVALLLGIVFGYVGLTATLCIAAGAFIAAILMLCACGCWLLFGND